MEVPEAQAYDASSTRSHREAPPQAEYTSTPGANRSTQPPVLLQRYSPSRSLSRVMPNLVLRSEAATVRASATLPGATKHESTPELPEATTTRMPCSAESARTASSSVRLHWPRAMPRLRVTMAGPAAGSCSRTTQSRPATTSLMEPEPAQSSTRTPTTRAPLARPTVRPTAVAATWVPCPSQSAASPSPSTKSGPTTARLPPPPPPQGANSWWLPRRPLSTTYTVTPSPPAPPSPRGPPYRSRPSSGRSRWSTRSRFHSAWCSSCTPPPANAATRPPCPPSPSPPPPLPAAKSAKPAAEGSPPRRSRRRSAARVLSACCAPSGGRHRAFHGGGPSALSTAASSSTYATPTHSSSAWIWESSKSPATAWTAAA
mmetsp:Transcript_27272/g.76148  ORF Transcript_27272/g.76148 Transcript_27272/m.76148 type:complete len:373 (+) Transcript_27272:492-1610(+)